MTRYWSPMATTGTRAGPNPPSPARYLPRDPATRPLLCGQLDLYRQGCRRPRHGQLCDGHRSGVLLRRRQHLSLGAQRCVDHPQVRVRKAGGSVPQQSTRPVRDPPAHDPPDDQDATRPPERYGLPKPDHKFGESDPTVSGRILDRIAHGTIAPKPNIASLEGERVRFADGSEVHADVVVYCTGYKITFPFFDETSGCARQPHRVVQARLSSATSRASTSSAYCSRRRDHAASRRPRARGWATICAASTPCPRRREVRRDIASDQAAMRKRYVASKRHTIRSTSTTTCMRWRPSVAPGPSGRGAGVRLARTGACRCSGRVAREFAVILGSLFVPEFMGAQAAYGGK